MVRHIAIDGIDGSGKTTLLARVAEKLSADGLKVAKVKFCPIATEALFSTSKAHLGVRAPRSFFRPEYVEYVFTCDEFANYFGSIKPLLEEGKFDVVLQDRSKVGRWVNVLMRGSPQSDCRLLLEQIPDPHCAFILNIDSATAHRRITQRGDLSPDESVESLDVSRELYLQVSNRLPYCTILDATRSIEELSSEVYGKIVASLCR